MTLFPANRQATQQSAVVFEDPECRARATLLIAGVPVPAATLVAGTDGLWPVFTATPTVLYYRTPGGQVVTFTPAVNTVTPQLAVQGAADDPEALILLFGQLAAIGLPVSYVSHAVVVIDTFDPTTLPITGGPMSIWGTGFLDATGVTFGGVAVTQFQVIADNHIACAVAAHVAGTVSVIVLSPRGNSDPVDFTFA